MCFEVKKYILGYKWLKSYSIYKHVTDSVPIESILLMSLGTTLITFSLLSIQHGRDKCQSSNFVLNVLNFNL